METYISKKSEINFISRMDYNFWAPRKELSKKYESKTLEECVGRDSLTASAFYPSIVPYYTSLKDADFDETEPFIRVTDARTGMIDYKKTVFLSKDILDKLSSSIKRVHPGDIVITKGGEYIGEAALVPDYYDEYGTCRDILCINMDRAIVSGKYLASYLQSEHGKRELIRTKSVQGQPHLTIDKVAVLKVPIYDRDFQDEIAALWDSFYELIDDANVHLENAKDIFENAINTSFHISAKPIMFVKSMKSKELSQRFDVDYYEKKWSNLVDTLKNEGIEFNEVKYVKQSFEILDPQQIFNYITLSDIDDKSGIIKRLKSMEAYKLPDRAKRKIQKGDVLVSSLKGSKEKIAIVDSKLDNIIASTGFYVVRDEKYLPEVLYLIFRSNYYDLFIEQMSSGAIMSSLTDRYFKQFLIPKLEWSIQKDIAEEVSTYISVRKMAFEKLDRAIALFDTINNLATEN